MWIVRFFTNLPFPLLRPSRLCQSISTLTHTTKTFYNLKQARSSFYAVRATSAKLGLLCTFKALMHIYHGTGCTTENSGFDPGKGKRFSVLQSTRLPCRRDPSSIIQELHEVASRKYSGRSMKSAPDEGACSPTEIKNVWTYISIPQYTFTVCFLTSKKGKLYLFLAAGGLEIVIIYVL